MPYYVLVFDWSFPLDFPELGEARKRLKASKFTNAQKALIFNQGEEGTVRSTTYDAKSAIREQRGIS